MHAHKPKFGSFLGIIRFRFFSFLAPFSSFFSARLHSLSFALHNLSDYRKMFGVKQVMGKALENKILFNFRRRGPIHHHFFIKTDNVVFQLAR